jgi:ABC-type nickel/cobalt efflux system permease component RcnA
MDPAASTDASRIAILAFGFALGLKHALDADHLVAVSTIVGRERSVWRSSVVGVVWGVGHSAALFVAALAVIVLRLRISPAVALLMELGVAIMLIVLGADLVRRVVRGEIALHSHPHTHGPTAPAHAHLHLHLHAPAVGHAAHHGIGRRPFMVGLMHGLAGSAALMLFVLSTIASPWLGLLYVAIFGAGTIGGMLVMAALMSLPFAVAARRRAGLLGRLQLAAGLGSLAFGAFYAWQVAVDGGLLVTLLR